MTFDPLAIPVAPAAPVDRTGGARSFVPSRLRVLNALTSNTLDARGWLLLTGEAGTGKSLLLDALAERLPTGWEAVLVELSPESAPACIHEALAEALGLSADPAVDPLRPIRLALSRAASDSRRLALLVDEAQNATDLVLETLRLLAGRIGQDDGLAAVVVAGQTSLLGRLGTARHQSTRNRMAAHFHLRGLDLAESATLLRLGDPGRVLTTDELEEHHRRVLGNPRLLFRLARSGRADAATAITAARAPIEAGPPAEAPGPVAPLPREDRRPPLRIEEGLIEVGVPDPEAALSGEERRIGVPPQPVEAVSILEPVGPMAVADPYADIQSRQEWEQLRGRIGATARTPVGGAVELEPQATGKAIRIRAETSHETRPLSRLFSRLESGPHTDDEIP